MISFSKKENWTIHYVAISIFFLCFLCIWSISSAAPSKATTFADGDFEFEPINSSSMENIVVNGDLYYTDFDYNTAIITGYKGDARTIVIPRFVNHGRHRYLVAEIGGSAFARLNSTKSVTIPSNIKKIGSYAFSKCDNLERIYTNKKLELMSVDSDAFKNCNASVQFTEQEHDWKLKRKKQEQTCNNYGKGLYRCANCGSETEKDIEPHTYKNNGFKYETVTISGNKEVKVYKKLKCSDCSKERNVYVASYLAYFPVENDYIYNGKEKKPDVDVELHNLNGCVSPASRYEYSYSNNKKAGKALVRVIINNSRIDEEIVATLPFVIAPRRIYKKDLSYDNTVVYSGKKQFPKVNGIRIDNSYYELKKGRDYSISVSGKHKEIGTYNVDVKFKGNYKGTVKYKMRIVPKKPNVKPRTYSGEKIKLSWNKVKKAQGYKVYRDNGKGLKLYKTTTKRTCLIKRVSKHFDRVDYAVVAYKKVKGRTYTSGKSFGWESVKPVMPKFNAWVQDFGIIAFKPTAAGKYQISISIDKNFEEQASFEVEIGKNDTATISYLKAGQKYYIKARKYAYNSKGRLLLSKWSKVKTITP